jgi:membrane protein DedA with SNARE-associated domain
MEELVAEYGYLAVGVISFLEGETIVVLGGFAAYRGYLSLPHVMLAAFIGTFFGDQLYFYLGRRWGRALLDRRPAWRVRAEHVSRLVNRYDTVFILGFRFLYGIRTFASFGMGMCNVPPRRFTPLNLVAAAVWAVAVASLGYFFGAAFDRIIGKAIEYEIYGFAVIGVGGVLVWSYYRIRRRRARSKV